MPSTPNPIDMGYVRTPSFTALPLSSSAFASPRSQLPLRCQSTSSLHTDSSSHPNRINQLLLHSELISRRKSSPYKIEWLIHLLLLIGALSKTSWNHYKSSLWCHQKLASQGEKNELPQVSSYSSNRNPIPSGMNRFSLLNLNAPQFLHRTHDAKREITVNWSHRSRLH